jgi:two-component system, NtrC family, sensor kinase
MDDPKKIESPDFKGLRHSKIGYFREVRTKIKQLEALNIQLAKRHNRLEAIFNSMSDGVTILDRHRNIVFANLVQARLFPEISDEGIKCHQLFYQRDEHCPNCPVAQTLQTGETLSGDHMFKKGHLAGRSFEWTTSPIADTYGKVAETILIMRDITERKNYEFKLMQSDRMVSVGFLANSLAHEINNPLTSIAGFSEGLLKRLKAKDPVLDAKAVASLKEYLEIINSEAYRCKDIIQNLREFSDSASDAFGPIDIDQIIADTIALIRQHAKDQRIKINFENRLTTGLNRVMGKSGQLKHLFLNLFKLSFNALPAGGVLNLIARNDGDRIDIHLSDPTKSLSAGLSGCMSYQLLDGSVDVGDGLEKRELSICYHILCQHRGSFRSMSPNDGDHRLVLRFPAALT